MPRDEGELEARLRAMLRDEAGEIWPPPTLWPRVQAQLTRRVEDIARGGGYPVPREGTLLPLLHRLEIEGLLDTRWRPGPQGLRRSYALSARGRRVRRRVWLTWRLVDLRAQL